ncbi:fumarate hydratase class II [Paraliobacillus quinghaiensis]|uniref:Fumarate hydratase class II n=1 Tax=Paraliobacillus quinghaiensis TaxID=470815 RepID=A0A917WSH0_9BACI|nr:class II fumarate hydratase [Paraliobacillus quinghaiensis]GGM25622.1 fumarate hydratase class II [Paraliobacillus quinghaiensis]
MCFRIEKDTLGEVHVPESKYWGAQTQRSIKNFAIGIEKMPKEIIAAFAILKRSAAIANNELDLLEKEKMDAIVYAAEEILTGNLAEHFPLVVWQTGSGTQTNMNVNEVIANVGNKWLQQQNSTARLHPNDDVNKSQSSNDTYPTAMHLSATLQLENHLLPSVRKLKNTLAKKMTDYQAVIKIGRTHLQDATPLTFGQEVSGWHHMLVKAEKMIEESMVYFRELAIGGTAVGTGLNAHPDFSQKVCQAITSYTNNEFVSAQNKFHALTSHDQFVHTHGALKALAADLMKIANDVRWLASGPRAGLGEVEIPANEPGSSIMPGKVNPTQAEAVTMVAAQVMGNDATIGFSASQGNFQLNVFKPVIAFNFLQSVQLLTDSMLSFDKHCMQGLEPIEKKMTQYLNDSLMLVTALNPHIGYEKAAKIAKLAYQQELKLKEAAVQLGFLSAEEFDQFIDPKDMV